MSDVLIRRCDVRVVRHGGWSWGPDPRRLLDELLAALPGVLASALSDLRVPPGAGPLEITRPLRVVVPVRAADLMAWRVGRPGADPPPTAVAGGLRAAVAAAVHAAGDSAVAGPDAAAASGSDSGGPSPTAAQLVLAMLAEACGLGWSVAALLELLPDQVVARWHELLMGAAEGARPAPPPGWVRAATGRHAPPNLPTIGGRSAILRVRLSVAVEWAAASGDARSLSTALLAALDQVLPVPASTEPGEDDEAIAAQPALAPVRDRPLITTGLGGRSMTARPPAPGDGRRSRALDVPTGVRPSRHSEEAAALPFLLLGPLAHLGFLAAVEAGFAAEHEGERLPALAAALAYKVGPPPDRGWRRESQDRASAAAFAGATDPIPDSELTALAVRATTLVVPAAAAVGVAVASEASDPAVIHTPPGGGVVAARAADLAPMAWSEDGRLPAALLRGCGVPSAFVGPGGAPPAVYAELRAAGISFATDVPPTRGERWRRVRGRRDLWGSGDRSAAAASASARAPLLADTAAALSARPAAPLGEAAVFEWALSVVAGAALASAAARLWAPAEVPDPLLMLERMSDLTCRLQIEPDRVRVLLPMGRRRADLFAAGLMDDVAGVPWLDGRVVEFGGA